MACQIKSVIADVVRDRFVTNLCLKFSLNKAKVMEMWNESMMAGTSSGPTDAAANLCDAMSKLCIDYSKLTVGDLRMKCGERMLSKSGVKSVLIARLEANDLDNLPSVCRLNTVEPMEIGDVVQQAPREEEEMEIDDNASQHTEEYDMEVEAEDKCIQVTDDEADCDQQAEAATESASVAKKAKLCKEELCSETDLDINLLTDEFGNVYDEETRLVFDEPLIVVGYLDGEDNLRPLSRKCIKFCKAHNLKYSEK